MGLLNDVFGSGGVAAQQQWYSEVQQKLNRQFEQQFEAQRRQYFDSARTIGIAVGNNDSVTNGNAWTTTIEFDTTKTKPRKETPLEWLDRRVDEMRVKL